MSRPNQSDAPQGGFATFRVQVKDGQTLHPGGSCLVHPLKADGTAITTREFTVHDPHYQAFSYSIAEPAHREQLLVAYNPTSKRYETHGEQGLRRKAKTPEGGGLAIDASGTVEIWHEVYSTLDLTVWLDWVHGGEGIGEEAELIIHYFRYDQANDPTGLGRWRVVAADCAA